MTCKALAAIAACAVLTATPALAAKLEVGKPAPNFQVTTFDGQKLSLSDLKGQVVVVNIWATWCGPCKIELPLLNAYYRNQKDNGLRVIAVTTEDSVPNSYLVPLSKLLTIPLARNFRGSGDYGRVKAVPTNYVIDRAGVLRYAEAGAFTEAGLNKVIGPLLEEEPPVAPSSATAALAALKAAP
jgi:cytochrome c biogenesis protein CcmG/thiol:disulfide interchange protein DsbE